MLYDAIKIVFIRFHHALFLAFKLNSLLSSSSSFIGNLRKEEKNTYMSRAMKLSLDICARKLLNLTEKRLNEFVDCQRVVCERSIEEFSRFPIIDDSLRLQQRNRAKINCESLNINPPEGSKSVAES